MSLSDAIQLVLSVVMAVTSVVAVVISILSLKQNEKMIESSSRPYVGIYLACTHIGSVACYLVVKNFGQSSAAIKSFACDFDLAKCSRSQREGCEPFQNIEGSVLLPSQSVCCVVNLTAAIRLVDRIGFHVVYSSGNRTYEEDIFINLAAASGNVLAHDTSEGKELRAISETLQDMLIRSL